jgi:hypothetical protein
MLQYFIFDKYTSLFDSFPLLPVLFKVAKFHSSKVSETILYEKNNPYLS